MKTSLFDKILYATDMSDNAKAATHYDKENLKSFSKGSIDENKKLLVEKIHTLCDETGSRINNCLITPKVLGAHRLLIRNC